MTLYDWKAFFRWLSDASNDELIKKRDEVSNALEFVLKERSTRQKARFMIRMIEEELIDRHNPGR